MNKKDLEYFKDILLKEKEKLLRKMGAHHETTMETMKESSSEHSAYSFHMADQGTDSQEREKAFLFAHRYDHYLRHVEEALRRIDRGEYGICESCNQSISKSRLEAVPIAKLCVDCKNKQKK